MGTSNHIIVLVLGTITGNNCYSQRAKLYNLGLSVSLAKYNYKVSFEFSVCLFLAFHFAFNPGYFSILRLCSIRRDWYFVFSNHHCGFYLVLDI